MRFTSATKLKAWVNNKAKKIDIPAPVLMKFYMMERLLERITLSKYRDNLILKGGFLIASMIGINLRSTMDMDTTVKNIELNRNSIMHIMHEIIIIDVNDDVTFEIKNITDIHEESEYDDFRMLLLAKFHTIEEYIKVDFTTGHVIIPHEIEYSYQLMFEKRTIPVMAYNLDTIFAEKIESILSRNVEGTRGRDFYDVYTLISLYKNSLSRSDILKAIRIKARERGTLKFIEEHNKYLHGIANSPEIAKVWKNYVNDYPYAKGIELSDVIELIAWLFEVY